MFWDLQGAVGHDDDTGDDTTDDADDDTGDDTTDDDDDYDDGDGDALAVSDAVIGYCEECINITLGLTCFRTCYHRPRWSVCGICSLTSLPRSPTPPALLPPEGDDLYRYIDVKG